jgi:hypothetical protein
LLSLKFSWGREKIFFLAKVPYFYFYSPLVTSRDCASIKISLQFISSQNNYSWRWSSSLHFLKLSIHSIIIIVLFSGRSNKNFRLMTQPRGKLWKSKVIKTKKSRKLFLWVRAIFSLEILFSCTRFLQVFPRNLQSRLSFSPLDLRWYTIFSLYFRVEQENSFQKIFLAQGL